MVYNTGNPSGSSDPRDLSDSSADIDTWATSTTADTHSDRLGTVRKTWRGMENEFDVDQVARANEFEADQDSREAQFVQLMISGGYTGTGADGAIEEYAAGITVSTYKEIIRDGGEFWRAAASTTLPHTTTGAGMPESGAFVNVGDGVLRQDLVQPVATFNSVADMKNSANLDVGRKARTLGYYTPGDGGGNDYEIVSGGTGTDDGGSFINLAGSGLQAKGLFSNDIYIKQFGAKWDSIEDDYAAIQAAVVYAQNPKPEGGETIILPQGTGLTSRPIEVSSELRIVGQGLTNTYLKATTGGQFLANQAVLQTVDFQTIQGTNLWDYYPPYADGLVMGLQLEGFTIDGNRSGGVTCGGLYVYGGKWLLGNIAAINTADHGIWTEAGLPGSSTSGNDLEDFLNMHESAGVNVYISNANKHGWFYRGPNDSYVDNIQIKTCGWAGFFQESTGNNSVGNLEIGSIHAYACQCNHDSQGAMIELSNANAQFLYVDASSKNGLRTYGSASIIDQVLVLANGNQSAGFWGIIADAATQINMVRNSDTKSKTTGSGGGLLQTNAETIIGQLRHFQNAGTTIAEKVAEINAPSTIKAANVASHNSIGSVVFDINSSRCDITLKAANCLSPIRYNVSGRNKIDLNALDCTNEIIYAVPSATTDIITLATNSRSNSQLTMGSVSAKVIRNLAEIAPPASSFTPNASSQSYVKIEALPANILINTPTNPVIGSNLILGFQQNGTGGHAVSFSSAFKLNYDPSGNTAFTRAYFHFIYDGAVWMQVNYARWI